MTFRTRRLPAQVLMKRGSHPFVQNSATSEEQRSKVLEQFKQGYQREAAKQTLFKGYLLAQLIGRLNPDPRHNPEQALKRQEAKQNARQLYEGFAGLQQAAEL